MITLVLVVGLLLLVYVVGLRGRPEEKTSRGGRSPVATGRRRPTKRQKTLYRPIPWWLRRLPLVLLIASVACLIVAITQFRVSRERATPVVALVIDASNSMDADDVEPNRLVAAQNAARVFLEQLPEEFEVTLVSFADRPSVLVTPSTERERLSQALADLPRGQGTVIGDGLATGVGQIETTWAGGEPGPAAVVLLSDGRDTGSQVAPLDAAAAAADRGIPVYTVVLGATSDGGGGANAALLEQMASTTGAQTFTAGTAGELSALYESLGSQLSTQLQIGSSAQVFVILAVAFGIGAALVVVIITLRQR